MGIVSVEIDALLSDSVECTVHDLHSALDDEFPRIELGHGLLHLKQREGDLRLVGNFHELHADDLDAADLNLIVEKVLHAKANDGAVGDEARLLPRIERKFSADAADDFKALVLDIVSRIFNRVTEGDGVLDSVVHDGGNGKRCPASIGHRGALERHSFDGSRHLEGLEAADARVPVEARVVLDVDYFATGFKYDCFLLSDALAALDAEDVERKEAHE